MAMEWVSVKNRDGSKIIGAIGFIGDTISVVVSFYADKDWNHDGKVDLSEKIFSIFSLKGKALAEVISRAYEDPDIVVRDHNIGQLRGKLLTEFGNGMIIEGAYKTYIAYSVSQAAGLAAGQITSNAIMSYVIKKGMEKSVESAFRAAVRR